MIETRRLKNVVIFFRNLLSFKSFVLSRSLQRYLQRYCTEIWICYSERFSKILKTRVQKEYTEIRHRLCQQLQTARSVSEIPYL